MFIFTTISAIIFILCCVFVLFVHVLFVALARHTLLQFLACAVGIERIANVYGLCVGYYNLSFLIVFQNCLSSIILGSFKFNNPFPDSNFLISVSSLYLLLGVPKKDVIIL